MTPSVDGGGAMIARARKRALNHQEPDRVPLDVGGTWVSGMTVEAHEKLKRHSGSQPQQYAWTRGAVSPGLMRRPWNGSPATHVPPSCAASLRARDWEISPQRSQNPPTALSMSCSGRKPSSKEAFIGSRQATHSRKRRSMILRSTRGPISTPPAATKRSKARCNGYSITRLRALHLTGVVQIGSRQDQPWTCPQSDHTKSPGQRSPTR